jgi:hypothetical protein
VVGRLRCYLSIYLDKFFHYLLQVVWSEVGVPDMSSGWFGGREALGRFSVHFHISF